MKLATALFTAMAIAPVALHATAVNDLAEGGFGADFSSVANESRVSALSISEAPAPAASSTLSFGGSTYTAPVSSFVLVPNVPEPTTYILIASSLGALALMRRRRA